MRVRWVLLDRGGRVRGCNIRVGVDMKVRGGVVGFLGFEFGAIVTACSDFCICLNSKGLESRR